MISQCEPFHLCLPRAEPVSARSRGHEQTVQESDHTGKPAAPLSKAEAVSSCRGRSGDAETAQRWVKAGYCGVPLPVPASCLAVADVADVTAFAEVAGESPTPCSRPTSRTIPRFVESRKSRREPRRQLGQHPERRRVSSPVVHE